MSTLLHQVDASPKGPNFITLPNGKVINLMEQWGYECSTTHDWIVPGIGRITQQGEVILVLVAQADEDEDEDEDEDWKKFCDDLP